MSDPYLYEDVPVLKNELGIKNEKTLDRIEAEQSRANMMLLYEQGFQDFSPDGLREIHRTLFADIYEWAGQYRIINIEKREKLLAGRSVWYSNDDRIEEDLNEAFERLENVEIMHITVILWTCPKGHFKFWHGWGLASIRTTKSCSLSQRRCVLSEIAVPF